MSNYSYATIVNKAKAIKKNVKSEYKLGETSKWAYYIAKAILKPETDIKKIKFTTAKNSNGDNFGRQIYKSDYTDMAKRFVAYTEKHHQMPDNIHVKDMKMRVSDYTYMFSRILVYYNTHGAYPKYANVNSKAFIKPTETANKVYDLFVKTFGKITCIDDALEKIAGRGYGYYYDDHKSNAETISAIKSSSHSDDPNCTDATQMMKNVADGTGKYKKVDCVHVKCKGGDGHVYLKVTQKDGSIFYRDPAAVLSSGVVSKVWCSDGRVLAINPSWWLANLNR